MPHCIFVAVLVIQDLLVILSSGSGAPNYVWIKPQESLPYIMPWNAAWKGLVVRLQGFMN